MIHPSEMSLLSLIALALLPVPTSVAIDSKVDVCRVSAIPANWIGKKVRVEGYIVDLSSHGFVLVSARGCTGHGQLVLLTSLVDGTMAWQSAFAESAGPKRAVLIGRVRWTQARAGGRIPALKVFHVESIARREARSDELS